MNLNERVYFLYGNDMNSISERIREISYLDNGCAEIEKIELNNQEDIESFLNQGSNVPLFSTTSRLKICLSIKIKADDNLILQFLDLLKAISIHKIVILVVCIEKYDKNIQKVLSENELFSSLSKIAKSEQHVKLMFWQKDKIVEKTNQLANQYNLKFEGNSLNLFVDCIKEDLDNIDAELQKIQTYLLPTNAVNEQVIQDLYFSSYNIDDLYKMLITKNDCSIAALLLRINKLKTPLYVIASLQNKLRQAFELKVYIEAGKNVNQISKLTGLHPYKLNKDIKQIQYISAFDLKNIFCQLSDIEFKVKSGIIKDENALDMIALSNWENV